MFLNYRQLNGRGIRFRRNQFAKPIRKWREEERGGQNERIVIGRSYWKTKRTYSNSLFPSVWAARWESDQYFRVDIRLAEQIHTLHSTLHILCRAHRNGHCCTSIVSTDSTLAALFSNPTFIYLPVIVLSSPAPPLLLGHCWMFPWFLTVFQGKGTPWTSLSRVIDFRAIFHVNILGLTS